MTTTLLASKRFVLLAALALLTAASFWGGSRYPALSEKALMGASTHIEGLSFDIALEVPGDASLALQFVGNSLNWMYTNRKGMAFGIAFGVLLMTMLPLLGRVQFRSRTANGLLGVALGSPLGLCVNCSTPVAQGLYAGGARVETMLAMMVSSPTLNVIVLTMLFSLFPAWLAVLKICLTLAVALLLIPLLARWAAPPAGDIPLSAQASRSPGLPTTPCGDGPPDGMAQARAERWWQALGWVIAQLARNLWLLVRMAVPLMVLAGVLGAAVVTFLPFSDLIEALPRGRAIDLAGMSLVALLGIFLPVPMAFDVILTAILLNAGLPMKYAIVLLFTLGIFSIYPFMVIWRDISRRLAVGLALGLAGLGVVAGAVGGKYYSWDYDRQVRLILQEFSQSGRAPQGLLVDRARQGRAAQELVPELQASALASLPVAGGGELAIRMTAFQPPSPAAEPWFTRIEGPQLGIDEPENFSLLKSAWQSVLGHGIAAGDVHNDGRADLALASDKGLALYANQRGRFVRQRIDIPELNALYVTNVALVDLNNDGWLDLYFSALHKGNYVIYNEQGQFPEKNLHSLPNLASATLTNATAFADIGRKGLLDIVVGNVAWCIHVTDAHRYCDGTQNVLLKHRAPGRFELAPLPGIHGPTLSLLVSDINMDGWPDLIVGNDLEQPDMYYLGDGKGGLRIVGKSDGLVTKSSKDTMSIISADVDNDLVPEIYLGQIAEPKPDGKRRAAKSPAEGCAEFVDPRVRDACSRFARFQAVVFGGKSRGDASDCLRLAARAEQDACLAYGLIALTHKEDGAEALCGRFPAGWDYLSFACRQRFSPHARLAAGETANAIAQQPFDNILLKRGAAGTYADVASRLGIADGGWSWNAKFADLDNDGWLDLYIGTGATVFDPPKGKFLYRNEQGRRFVDRTAAAGLDSVVDAPAYVFIDIDNDGDLDIVTLPNIGPVIAYRNNAQTGNAIEFELRDHRGNRFGIGSKIFIYYGDGRKQYREILASGGYQSFDAPIAHFGLGEARAVQRVEIEWSTGERSILGREFAAGARYSITRER